MNGIHGPDEVSSSTCTWNPVDAAPNGLEATTASIPRESRYPVFEVLLQKTIEGVVFGSRKPQSLGAWTLWYSALPTLGLQRMVCARSGPVAPGLLSLGGLQVASPTTLVTDVMGCCFWVPI